ncbi:MAG TPA: hypothetical protein VHB50_03380, partial [Bryobacteraceae bacterium]|nr:hypothetical protein [Bryobacteraceae bacterium]
MMTVNVDSLLPDNIRRERLYRGDIFLFSPRPSSIALCEFAREMICDAFGTIDPRTAQYEMPVEKYVSIVAPLKPRFIHHPESRRLIREILQDVGADVETTYLDVPRLRMVTSDGYLTSGVGYAHHPHRDTWYSAPATQLNWWLPIYPIEPENSMAFHPAYWDRAVKNGSRRFNYYQWNAVGRASAASFVNSDTRDQPKPEEPIEPEPAIRFVTEPGGMIVFSGAQLHSTVPNTSGVARYSIDFRTIDINDTIQKRGARNLDWECTGTSLRD